MTRMEEYQALRAELETAPEALENTVERALTREKTCRKKKRFWGIPVGSLAACFALFLLLVNCFPTFAAACEGLPVLGGLAEALQFDKSLRLAVENEYVQPLGLSQTENGITARVEYLIVDQKNVNIFFRFFAKDGRPLRAGYSADTPGCVSVMENLDLMEDGTLRRIGIMATDELPDTLALTLRAYDGEYGSDDLAAEFHFTIEYDPSFTAQGEVIPVGTAFTLEGQTLIVDRAEIYPTHMRLIIQEAAENTAELASLDFCLTDDRGRTYDAGAGCLIRMGTAENGEYCYLVESPWFQNGKSYTLHIRGAQFLSKDRPPVRVDLRAKTAERLPDGVSLKDVQRQSDMWVILFDRTPPPEGLTHSSTQFTSYYRSEDGTREGHTGIGVRTDNTEEYLTLEDGYPEDVVYLFLCYDSTIFLPKSLDIPLN